jgi:hypothetical protein
LRLVTLIKVLKVLQILLQPAQWTPQVPEPWEQILALLDLEQGHLERAEQEQTLAEPALLEQVLVALDLEPEHLEQEQVAQELELVAQEPEHLELEHLELELELLDQDQAAQEVVPALQLHNSCKRLTNKKGLYIKPFFI